MNKYTLEDIFEYTEEYLNDFLKKPQLSLLEKRYYTLKFLYENNYIDEKDLKYILSPNFVPNLYKTNVISDIKKLTLNLDINQFYEQLKTSQKYNCAESIPIFPVYKQQFTHEELNNMGEDELNKLFTLYCIEDVTTTHSLLNSLFIREDDNRKYDFEQAFREANLDLTNIRKYFGSFKYHPSNIDNNIIKEMKIMTILFFYYIVNKYGYKNVLNEPKEMPDINNLPAPICIGADHVYCPSEPSYLTFREKYSDWFTEQFLQQLFANRAIHKYVYDDFIKTNKDCLNGINLVDNKLMSQLLNVFCLASKTPCDLMVYKYYTRDISRSQIDSVNNIYMENRFMSTSLRSGINQGRKDQLNLFIPKGTSCLSLVETFGMGNEAEILLPPGTKFHIYKTEVNESFKEIYHAYLV